MKVRLVEDLEIMRCGLSVSDEELKRMNRIREYDIPDDFLLSNLLYAANIRLEKHRVKKETENTGEMVIDFYDLVYVNNRLMADDDGKLRDGSLNDGDFVLISRSEGANFLTNYPWAKYWVEEYLSKCPGVKSAKRLRGLSIVQMLVWDNIFPSLEDAKKNENLININNGIKNIHDVLEWGDQISIGLSVDHDRCQVKKINIPNYCRIII